MAGKRDSNISVSSEDADMFPPATRTDHTNKSYYKWPSINTRDVTVLHDEPVAIPVADPNASFGEKLRAAGIRESTNVEDRRGETKTAARRRTPNEDIHEALY